MRRHRRPGAAEHLTGRHALPAPLLAALALTLGACGGTSPSAAPVGGGPTSSSSPSAPSASPGSSSPVPAGTADWTTYQHDAARSGTVAGAVGPKVRRVWSSPTLDGDVYAQALIVGGQVIVATEHDSLYALDASTGKVRWHVNFGLPLFASQLPCGDVDPVGITGTPVVDRSARLVWVVPFLQPGRYDLVSVDLSTGALRSRQPIAPPQFDPLVENQRAALTLANGKVYVPFGGRYGDCGRYHGWIVAATSSGTGNRPLISWAVPSGREAGIWTPAGVSVDAQGSVYAATGNSASTDRYDDGNSVIRLSADLVALDTFAPASWAAANQLDADLGSTGPTLVDGGRVFQVGKPGVGYLLDASHLGGIGGALTSTKVCPNGGAFGANAWSPPLVLVACTSGLSAVRVAADQLSVAWHGPSDDMGPPVVSGDVVWAVDLSHGQLLGFDRASGAVSGRYNVGGVPHFAAPAVGDGEVIVPSGRGVVAFG